MSTTILTSPRLDIRLLAKAWQYSPLQSLQLYIDVSSVTPQLLPLGEPRGEQKLLKRPQCSYFPKSIKFYRLVPTTGSLWFKRGSIPGGNVTKKIGLNWFKLYKSMGNQRVTFTPLSKWTLVILLHLKRWSKYHECKNSIFVNINQLHVI